MKFSVITVTYQDDLGLKKTLKSLSKIDKHRYELIIIDGGSKDKTLQIINENSAFIDRWV
jgi:glycosyltransferase involved in cell wall biosynthesis